MLFQRATLESYTTVAGPLPWETDQDLKVKELEAKKKKKGKKHSTPCNDDFDT